MHIYIYICIQAFLHVHQVECNESTSPESSAFNASVI